MKKIFCLSFPSQMADPKFLCLSDPHYRVGNVDETDHLYKKLRKHLKTNKYDFIVLLGDTLDNHEKIWTTAYNRALDLFHLLRKYAPLYVLIGNHDYIDHFQFLTDAHPFNPCKKWSEGPDAHKITIVDDVIRENIMGRDYIFAPFVPRGRFIEALTLRLGEDWKSITGCLFAHQDFNGGKMGKVLIEDADDWLDEWPLVISGHLHDTQSLGQVYYLGACLQRSDGESNKKRLLKCEYREGKLAMDQLDLKLPIYEAKELTVEELKNYEFPDCLGNKIRLKIRGDEKEFKTAVKALDLDELKQKGINITYKKERKKKLDKEEGGERHSVASFKDLLYSYMTTENLKKYYGHILNGDKFEMI